MGPLLAAACEELRKAGVVYIVGSRGVIQTVTAEEYAALPPHRLMGVRVCITLEAARVESARRAAWDREIDEEKRRDYALDDLRERDARRGGDE